MFPLSSDPEVDPDLCQHCSVVIAMIPEVKLGLAMRAFNCLVHGVLLGRYEGPLEVSRSEAVGVVAVAGSGGQEVITPKGARLLKRMFEAGLIPQKRAASPQDLFALEAYIAGEPDLLRQTAERRVVLGAKELG